MRMQPPRRKGIDLFNIWHADHVSLRKAAKRKQGLGNGYHIDSLGSGPGLRQLLLVHAGGVQRGGGGRGPRADADVHIAHAAPQVPQGHHAAHAGWTCQITFVVISLVTYAGNMKA